MLQRKIYGFDCTKKVEFWHSCKVGITKKQQKLICLFVCLFVWNSAKANISSSPSTPLLWLRCQFANASDSSTQFYNTVCFRDLAKLNCLWWFDFKLEPIFDTSPAASKNEAHVKSGQNWPKNNRLATYNLNPWNSLYQ